MKKLYTARVKTAEYKTKNGDIKSIWETIGNVYEGDNNKTFMYLKRHFNPAGIDASNGDSIMVYLFPDEEPSSSSQNINVIKRTESEVNNQQDHQFTHSQQYNKFQNPLPFDVDDMTPQLHFPPIFNNN